VTGKLADEWGDGWRWESYQTIEVQVPEEWGYGTTSQPPCLVREAQSPYVGRPGVIRDIACRDPLPPLPYRASYLWFDTKTRNPPMTARATAQGIADGTRTPGVKPPDHGWVEETRDVDGVYITVLSDDDSLRQGILDSARVIDGSDVNGCTPDHPLAHHPEGRPTSTGGLTSLGIIESVSIGRYAIGEYAKRWQRAALRASSGLSAEAARSMVEAIISAPEGSGPDVENCLDTYGSEILVLTVRASDRSQEVLIRYDGCRFNGTDDGVTLRRLTADVLRPILTGIHRPSHYTGPLYELVVGPHPSK
jgi:hypothetical protein